MRRLIRLDAEAEEVRPGRRARWPSGPATMPARRPSSSDYCKLVLELGYGTEAAKDALKRLAKD